MILTLLGRSKKGQKIVFLIITTVIRIFITVSGLLFLVLSLMVFKPFLRWFIQARDSMISGSDFQSRFMYWFSGFIPAWLFIVILGITFWLVWKGWVYRSPGSEPVKKEGKR
jgi:hypothetical protein